MPERSSAIPAWAWIVGAVLAIVSIFAGYRMVQTQQHLVAAQSELESAKQAVEKANAERNELQTKLEDATSEVRSAQSVLAETKSVLEAAQSELERATQVHYRGYLITAERIDHDWRLDVHPTRSEFPISISIVSPYLIRPGRKPLRRLGAALIGCSPAENRASRCFSAERPDR